MIEPTCANQGLEDKDQEERTDGGSGPVGFFSDCVCGCYIQPKLELRCTSVGNFGSILKGSVFISIVFL